MNKVILKGNISQDVRTWEKDGEITVARTSLAVNRRVRKDQERQADFFDVVAFGKTAGILGSFKKGNELLIVGHLQRDAYNDKDGNKRYAVNVIIDEIDFTRSNGKSNDGSAQAPKQSTPAQEGFTDIDDEELPWH